MSQGERRLAAIMFTDMVGYTALTQKSERLAMELLAEHNALLRPIFPKFGGREIKTIGDSFLVEFSSALEAVRCAVAVQEYLHNRNQGLLTERNIQLRVGIHIGDVISNGGDIFGDAVNISSRIEPLAEPGGVCISEQVYDQVRNKLELRLIKLGNAFLKNVSVPVDVYRIVMPWTRYDSTEITELDKTRVAVLPFASMSPDPNDEYFADGMTEELISTTSSITGLTLIARTSVMSYKGTDKKVREIGRELEVGTVLEGSVRKAGNRLRVTVQLIDAQSQGHLWAQTYDRDFADVFAVQSDIAQRVARALKIQLLAKDKKRVEIRPTKSTEAFTLYLKGRNYWNERTKEGLTKAVGYFEKATQVDPDYARAYLGLAESYLVFGDYGILPSSEAFPKARTLATKALELDKDLAEAHASLGSVMNHEWDWVGAERELRLAIELSPNYATAHQWYGIFLNSMGRHSEAMEEIKRAQKLDPLSPIIAANIGITHYFERRYDDAVDRFKLLIETYPNFLPTHVQLAIVYALKSMFDEAELEIQKAKALSPATAAVLLNDVLAYSYAMTGRREEAMKLLDEMLERSRKEHVSPVVIAGAYIALEKDKAFEWLEKAYEVRDSLLMYLGSPFWDTLRSDPRFAVLQKKIGLGK